MRLGCHGLRYRSHATDRVSPDTRLAVHFTEHMVQEYIGAARGVRTRVAADHGVEAIKRFQCVGLEPVI
jgi:hypothetical protein